MKNAVAYIGAALALVGALLKAGSIYGDLNARIRILESDQRFYHGDSPPKGVTNVSHESID